MAKKIMTFALVVFALLSFASCGNQPEQPSQSSVYAVLGEKFSVIDTFITVKSFEKVNSIQVQVESGRSENRWPKFGMFYILKIEIEPTEKTALDMGKLRYEIADVKGQRYFAAEGDVNAVYSQKIKTSNLLDLTNKLSSKTETVIVIDCSVGIQGLTFEIIKKDQNPERILAVVDLKE